MKTKKTEMKVYQIDLMCDECCSLMEIQKKERKKVGGAYLVDAVYCPNPTYTYKCTECGHIQVENEIFPKKEMEC